MQTYVFLFGAKTMQGEASFVEKVHIGSRKQMIKFDEICGPRYVKIGYNLGQENANLSVCRDIYGQMAQN